MGMKLACPIFPGCVFKAAILETSLLEYEMFDSLQDKMLRACIYANDALHSRLNQETDPVSAATKLGWVGRFCVLSIRWAQEAIHLLMVDNTDDAVSFLSPSQVL